MSEIVLGDHVKLNELRVWSHVVPKCKVIFDVGCREDTHMIELSTPGASIHLFDVNNETIKRLSSNAKVPDGVNALFHSYGLGKTTRHVSYFPNTESAYARPGLSTADNVGFLPVMTLVDHLKNHPVEKVDFFKIDTEGYEMEILESIMDARLPIGLLQFEVGSCWFEKEGKEKSIIALNDLFGNYESYVVFDQRNPFFSDRDTLLVRVTRASDILPQLESGCGFDVIIPLLESGFELVRSMKDLQVTQEEIIASRKLR
jgi:FkbM family methyltransferase